MSIDVRWSTDLVTYFHPPWWGLPADLTYDAWEKAVDSDPEPYFRRMLDSAAAARLRGIELAPAPGGWVNALRAFGSAAAFRHELESRGLTLSSSYVLPVLLKAALDAPPESRRAAEHALDDEVTQHAEFLAEVGCPTLVTSTVPRAEFSDIAGEPASAAAFDAPADPDLLGAIADQLDRIGTVAARHGVSVAVHTDAYSLASRTADVDALMDRTDPARVKLCIDAGHIALDGGDPLAVLRAHADRAPVLHWKDCASHLPPHTLSGPPMVRHDTMIRYFRVMGSDGVVDWNRWIDILRDKRWTGWGVAEIDMSVDPQREIREGIEYYERVCRPQTSALRGGDYGAATP